LPSHVFADVIERGVDKQTIAATARLSHSERVFIRHAQVELVLFLKPNADGFSDSVLRGFPPAGLNVVRTRFTNARAGNCKIVRDGFSASAEP
jgi:hypothetical protein